MPGCRLTITVEDPEEELAMLLTVSNAMAFMTRELPGVKIAVSESIDVVDRSGTLHPIPE